MLTSQASKTDQFHAKSIRTRWHKKHRAVWSTATRHPKILQFNNHTNSVLTFCKMSFTRTWALFLKLMEHPVWIFLRKNSILKHLKIYVLGNIQILPLWLLGECIVSLLWRGGWAAAVASWAHVCVTPALLPIQFLINTPMRSWELGTSTWVSHGGKLDEFPRSWFSRYWASGTVGIWEMS